MQLLGYIAITTGVMGHVYGGKNYLIYNCGFPPCYLMKKANTSNSRRPNTPQEKVTTFPCLAFADIGGSDVVIWKHQAECFHLSIFPDELSHVLEGASHWLTRRLGFLHFCCLMSQNEKTTKNLQSATQPQQLRGHDPDLLNHSKIPIKREGNLLGSLKKKQP